MQNVGPVFITIFAGVVGLAIVAVLVSKNANTSAVFTGAGSALSGIIGAAVAPVSGSQSNNFGSPASGATGGLSGAPTSGVVGGGVP